MYKVLTSDICRLLFLFLVNRPFRVRVVFLIATAFLMVFAYLLVDMGLTNVNNAARSMIESLNVSKLFHESVQFGCTVLTSLDQFFVVEDW